nr:hypothetical protein Iba_chr09cCG4650 [Ipomoea batatas]
MAARAVGVVENPFSDNDSSLSLHYYRKGGRFVDIGFRGARIAISGVTHFLALRLLTKEKKNITSEPFEYELKGKEETHLGQLKSILKILILGESNQKAGNANGLDIVFSGMSMKMDISRFVRLDQLVHLLHLRLLLQVLGLLPPVAPDHHQVHQLPQPRVLGVPLDKPDELTDAPRSRHRCIASPRFRGEGLSASSPSQSKGSRGSYLLLKSTELPVQANLCFVCSTYNEDSRFDVKPLLLNALNHLALQGRNLIQDVNNLKTESRMSPQNTTALNIKNVDQEHVMHLATSVRVSQHILLGEIPVGGKNDNIEHHGNPAQEFLEGARIGGFKEVKKHTDHLQNTLRGVSPPPFQPDFLEPMFKFRVGEVSVKELNSIPNRLGESGLGKGCSKWLKIQFQNKVAINFLKGMIIEFILVTFADSFKLSQQLMMLQDSLPMAFNPETDKNPLLLKHLFNYPQNLIAVGGQRGVKALTEAMNTGQNTISHGSRRSKLQERK